MTEKLQPRIVVVDNDNTPTTTTLIIAEGTGIQHASVIKLVRQNVSALEEFGRVRFEIRPFETAGGTQTREIAILNEQQATLLFTFMKNTKIVKEFKIALVKAFYEMAKKLREQKPTAPALPNFLDPAAAAIAWAEQYRKAQALENRIKEDAPKVEFANDIIAGDDDYLVRQVAKMIGYPERKLWQFLREIGWVFPKKREPYSEFVKCGYLTFLPGEYTHKDGTKDRNPYCHVKGKGVFVLYNRLRKAGLIDRNDQIEMSMK